tara:strand:+ start:20 stop:310 length:291 start_codon:yes stop_codon:yes gene_type:complete
MLYIISIFNTLKIRKFIILFTIIFLNLNLNAFAGEIDIEFKLLKRKEISKFDLKNQILKSKNVNFKKLTTLKVDYYNSEINCYFGYQDNLRIVLCY